MDNYFIFELGNIKKELTRLKTSMSKSAGVIQTVSTTIDVNIPLALSSGGTQAKGYKYYNIITEQDAIIMCTLDWYSENILVDYQIPRIVRGSSFSQREVDGIMRLTIGAYGTEYGENNDVSRLSRGESVSVNNKLTIRATSNFQIQEVYE